MDAEELFSAGRKLEQAAANARPWVREVAANASRVKTESEDLLAASLNTQSEARLLARAARRRMCVGVFGPSQAGKSYLVSRLAVKHSDGNAETESNRLVVELGGQSLDFIEKINPAGDKESTGLVTRFTTERFQTPDGFPVAVRLFSETDLVRVFANSYFLDFDHHNLEFDAPKNSDAIRSIIDDVKGQRSGETLAHLDEVAVYGLRSYFERSFKVSSEFLESAQYWQAVSDIAATLSLDARAKLFSVLWGGIEEFTNLYKRLVSFLSDLEFSDDAFVSEDALVPRDTSIIDVDRVKLELGDAMESEFPLRVTTSAMNGQREIAVPRATLCALVAELQLSVKSDTWKFLDHTDLLDFPGARSREKYRKIDENVDSEIDITARARELFIRGKVAMLFQRYAEERELSSMLLCMPPSNAEVKDLGLMVKDWVHLTHGDSPAERARQDNALFLILTKSDDDFKSKDGEDEGSIKQKWRRRLHASMREPFDRDGWINDWEEAGGQSQPFRNLLWLRNPGVEQPHLIAYERQGDSLREVGTAESIKARLPELKRYFLEDEMVTRHFVEPEAAFDALLTLNDGGISYLATRLDKVSDPNTKTRQVTARLTFTQDKFVERFIRFFEGGDLASQQKKREEAVAAIERLGLMFAETRFRSFGLYLRELRAVPEDFYELYLGIARFEAADDSPDDHPKVDATTSVFDFMDDDDEPMESDAESVRENGSRATRSQEEDPRIDEFAEQSVAKWIKRIRDSVSGNEFNKDAVEAKSFIVEQLVTGAHRHELAAEISRAMHGRSQVVSTAWEDLAQLGALITANSINDLVSQLGFADLDDDAKPPVPPGPATTKRRAFAPPGALDEGLPELGKRRRAIERDFSQDWLASVVQLTVDNAGFSRGREINEQQNARLGEILSLAKNVDSIDQLGGAD